MNKDSKPKITLFYCINSMDEDGLASFYDVFDLKIVKMACSSMVKDVFLLRGFEAGADGVVVLVCPEGQCRYTEGNLRAKKRVNWVKNLLDEIGINGKRLSLFNLSLRDKDAVQGVIQEILKNIDEAGANPLTV